nr:unnamed protein product [Naegleria fowleri]
MRSRLGSIHGPVLFEIFKYLHSKHLLSSIVLVCREWKAIVSECVLKLELKENDYPSWLKEQMNIFGNHPNPNSTVMCPQTTIYSHVYQLMTSIGVFENLQDLSLIGYEDLMSSDLLWHLLVTLKHLKRLLLSDCHLLEGQLARTLTFSNERTKSNHNDDGFNKEGEYRGFFSSWFSKKNKTNTTETLESSSSLEKSSNRHRPVKYSERNTVVLKFERVPHKTFIPPHCVEHLTSLCLFKVHVPIVLYDILMKKLVNLKEFRMVDCNLTKFEIFSSSNSLSHVEINRTNCDNATITISEKKENLITQTLEFLVLNNVSIESNRAWNFFANCSKLKTLKMRKYVSVPTSSNSSSTMTTTTSIENLCVEGIGVDSYFFKALNQWTPNLKRMEILHCSSLVAQEPLLSVITENFKQLTHLRVVNVRNLASSDIHSHTLEYLDLSSNKDLQCAIHCNSLKYLNLGGTAITDAEKTKIVMKNSSLEELNLSMMDSNEAIGNAWTLGKLKRLDLSYNRKVDDDRLAEILQFMNLLEYLNLKMCKNIHQVPLKKNSNLKTLLLSGTQITDESLMKVTLLTPELQRLDIDCCGMLKDPQLSHLHKLSSLDVSENISFSLKTILGLVKQIPSLRYYYARWFSNLISNLTNTKELMDAFRNLLLLDLTGSASSTCTVLNQLRDEFKDLIIVSKTPSFRCDVIPYPFTVFGTKL